MALGLNRYPQPCVEVEMIRAETFLEQAKRRKTEAETKVAEMDRLIALLESNPAIEEVMNLVVKL